ncbi:MAG: 4Fe-4S binding protein [Treponema sp.]|nr:4Fe-4S binding protein [Treponema sp.]
MAASITRDGKWLRDNVIDSSTSNTADTRVVDDKTKVNAQNTITQLSDGTLVINTTDIGKDIIGYAGTVPVEIQVKDNHIQKIVALENTETPDFFEAASSILNSWDGLTLEEATAKDVDVVSGATFSSKAIISNVKEGLLYAQNTSINKSILSEFDASPKNIIALIVALMAAILPLFIKNKMYRTIQLALNVIVLGFWCGTFISYSSLLGYMSNGMNIMALTVPVVLLITAFIYPLFGKKSYYCTNVCPFGSLQELTGRTMKQKIKISSKTIKRLDTFRQYLWAVLMLCLWTGIWFDWVDYEPFSAFIIQSASWVVIAIAIIFTILSSVVMRPYCRFVCPTGTLFKISQSNK